MPALSADDRARRRADLAPMVTTTPTLVTIARAPAGAAKRSGVEAIASDVPMMIWPADGQTPPKGIELFGDVGGQRVSAIGYVLHTTDIRRGDEVQTGTTRYKVVAVASWQATTGALLNEVVG